MLSLPFLKDLYEDLIAPYKGQIESWYLLNDTLTNYFLFIVIIMIEE